MYLLHVTHGRMYKIYKPACRCSNSSVLESPAILISENSAVSVLTSILKQPVPSLPLLSTVNLTTVTLCTTIFLSLKYVASSRFRTVLLALWLIKLLNLVISHPSSDLCTGSRTTNALYINSSHLPTKFSLPANPSNYTILSLFSIHVETAPHLLSS